MRASLTKALFKLHLLTPRGIFRLLTSFMVEGVTLMAILRFTKKYYGNECAIVSDNQRLTYTKLYEQAKQMAQVLYQSGLRPKMKVGLLCRNHATSAMVLTALSRLGTNIRLLNTDMVAEKIEGLISRGKIDYLIYDEELKEKCLPSELTCQTISTETIDQKFKDGVYENVKLPHIFRGAQISVLTGGSSGVYKEASRKTGLFQFLPPFFALLQDIHIQDYKSVYVVLPFYHGFGLGVLIIALAMGKKICLSRHFSTEGALDTISNEAIEVLPIVPSMLARIWQAEKATEQMKSVKCIISGGDRLDKKTLDATRQNLGHILFNLYGTTEAGFFMMATPECLAKNDEVALGEPIKGVECDVREIGADGVGKLYVRSKWAMIGQQNVWQATGDLAYRNAEGIYFHRGISKNMAVCGGENVYPENVERVLNAHPDIVASKVYATSDANYGSVLNAQVELTKDSTLTEEALKVWAHDKLSRAEMPHKFVFKELQLLSTGKRRV